MIRPIHDQYCHVQTSVVSCLNINHKTSEAMESDSNVESVTSASRRIGNMIKQAWLRSIVSTPILGFSLKKLIA